MAGWSAPTPFRVGIEAVDPGTSLFDLSLFATAHAGGLTLTAEYASDLFDESTLDILLWRFERLVAAVVHDPSLKL